MNAFHKLLRGDQLWPKAARFALVGGFSTLIHGILTLVAVQRWGLSPLLATLVGYVIAIPMNYLLQRVFTFQSNATMKHELPRFIIIHGLNMAGSFGIMLLIVESLHWDFRWGIVATMTAMPILAFIAMHAWVFPRSSS